MTGAAFAQPTVDALLPAGGQPGATVAVEVVGKTPEWPVEVWSSSDGVRGEPGEKKGELSITVAADAPPGLVWLRVFDAKGASRMRPFVVHRQPAVLEKETNDAPSQAQPVELPAVVHGRLAKRGDVDGFAVTLEPGKTLTAWINAHRVLGSPMDAIIQVCDADGFVLTQNDDTHGLDPHVTFTADRAGTYIVRTFAFPETATSSISFAGGDDFIYQLTLTTEPPADPTMPLGGQVDVGETASREQPQPITVPASLVGRLRQPGSVHAFTFDAKKGDKIDVQVVSKTLGYPMDPLLQITDASGKVLSRVDDSNREADPQTTWTAPADGTYRLLVSDLHSRGGPRFFYRVTAEPATPAFKLTLESDAAAVKPGGSLEVAVTIERLHGFSGEIVITAGDLPPGVTSPPVISKAEGDTAKQVKLKLTADAEAVAGHRVIRVEGRSKSAKDGGEEAGEEADDAVIATFSLPGVGREDGRLWLTVSP